ncbi:hypothetical protein KJ660_02025, partial [Candidatus Micrarchaeota archaeon]|nr:hypothetical protein [Candidatus Micrarchaeota archaeon]
EKAEKKVNELKAEEKENGKILGEKKEEVNKEMIEKVEKEIRFVEDIIEGLRKVRECSNLKEEEEKLEKELKELDFKEKELAEVRKGIVFLESGINSNLKEMVSNEEMIIEWKQQLKDAVELKEKLHGIEKGVVHQKEMVSKLNLFTNALIATQAELREELIDTINQAMDDVWNRIYPYQDFTSARMEIEEGNYELKVRERNGKWVRVEGILSGGERSAAAICIRIAFSLVLAQNLGWLILDEPTHNLDRATVRELTNTMKNHLPELVEQIFVITHDPEMEKAASASYYFLERNKNEEGITIPTTNEIN